MNATRSNVGDTDQDGLLDVTETWSYTGSYVASQTLIDGGGTLDNIATATGTDAQGTTVNDDDNASVPIIYNPSISLEKYVDVGFGFQDADVATEPEVNIAGGNATFRIELANTGNVTLTGISITDIDSQLGPINLSGYTLVESIANDGILDVGETAYLEYTVPLTAGQHENVATVITNEGVIDDNPAFYFGLINEGSGVRTPGGWGNSFKLLSFWDGIEGNEDPYEEDEAIPADELLYNADSNRNGELGDPDDKGLLIGDYNRNGLTDGGETTIFISHEDALALVNNEFGTKQDKADDVGRQMTASWLNFLAGNEIGGATDGDPETPRDWVDEGIEWLLANAVGNNDGIFGGYGQVRTKETSFRESVDGIASGQAILNALDEYNNHGTINGVTYAHDADDASFVTALSTYVDTFDFI